MNPKRLFPLGLVFLALLVACGPSEKTKQLMEDAKRTFGVLPAKMPGSEKDTPERIALGEKLYFEKRLSINDSQSCSSCHGIQGKSAGVDNLSTSPGALGKNGDRNSPTSLNAGFHFVQFWDGRAADLKAQAKGPILNPIEMGMPSEVEVEKKLSAIPEYTEAFAKAFPADEKKISYDNIAEAIAAFERTLITKDRFDEFQAGNYRALTSEEQKGLETFINTGCIQCHNGPLLGGNSFRKLGQVHPHENTQDKGRFAVTKNNADLFFFKVPSLRNVALTGPYFHDGKVSTLEDAVKKMAHLQLGKELSAEEVGSIVSFLKALSDKNRSN
ncbi:cytochrome-c peroxidase [Leptospira langatensis]|uniref:Cytochrome-c peroxidase n=1 Tax=Leptospira langatensis TaxID=2484983 RepID=A0A5F1ZSM2_9LEPT|nr:cytochrome-c peroxidase [Leptospira langatensis]TGJ98793.1 cytochrome-c peroxidase [Leptospira langatensis]TGL40640.1 cytochrome-c peroxidase [Leptospira langatensis]